MSEKRSTGEPVVKDAGEVTEYVAYYTFAGKEDLLDDDGYPCQLEENNLTYAKQVGKHTLLRLDRMGKFINPNGLYAQDMKASRWITVSKKVFTNYIKFLKTKQQSFYLYAEREAMNG
jgi:hypothetical protein